MELSYRIDYCPQDASSPGGELANRILMTGVFFVCFLSMVCMFWPEGREVLRLFLIPGDPDITTQAAETFALQLQEGSGLKSAWQEFLQTVIGYGTAV